MQHSTRLADLLQPTFGLHRARVTCLASLVIALFRVKTVNPAGLATALPGTADIDSHYRRLQRFFKHVRLQPARVATFVLAFLPDAPYTLAHLGPCTDLTLPSSDTFTELKNLEEMPY